MKHPQHYLREACERSPELDVRFRSAYSGRGMFGDKCVGITGERGACLAIVADAISAAAASIANPQLGSTQEETQRAFRELVGILSQHTQDSMGMGVILYWPRLQSIDHDED